MEYNYLLDACIILVATKIFSILSTKIQLPQVVGALVAGLLLGPAVFGILGHSEFLEQSAEIGVIIIMFSAGLETSLKDLKSAGKSSFVIALAGVTVPLLSGVALMQFFGDGDLLSGFFIGTILTATSVSITVATLKEMGKLSTKVGNTILAAALFDDILGLICLTVVTSLGDSSVNIAFVLFKIVLFFVFCVIVGIIFNKLFVLYDKRAHDANLHRYPIIALALCLMLAWSAEAIFGVADIIGAFAAGLIISTTSKRTYIETKINPLSYLFFSPIFFANIGLGVFIPSIDATLIIFTLVLIVVAVLSKLLSCYLAAKTQKFNARQAIQIGLGMVCRGEVALIVATKGQNLGLIDSSIFTPIVIMVIFCSIATPAFLKLAFKNDDKYEGLVMSGLVDNIEMKENLDVVTNQLIDNEKK